MAELPCQKELEAVRYLLEQDTPENMITTLDEFFEEWLCSSRIDNYSSDTRAAFYAHYITIKKFLKDIQ